MGAPSEPERRCVATSAKASVAKGCCARSRRIGRTRSSQVWPPDTPRRHRS